MFARINNILKNHVVVFGLQMWEQLLLNILKWDVSAITAHDFLWYILKRLNMDSAKPFMDIVIKHCSTFIGMCARGKTQIFIILVHYIKNYITVKIIPNFVGKNCWGIEFL